VDVPILVLTVVGIVLAGAQVYYAWRQREDFHEAEAKAKAAADRIIHKPTPKEVDEFGGIKWDPELFKKYSQGPMMVNSYLIWAVLLMLLLFQSDSFVEWIKTIFPQP
jgi:hypothetical protein